LQQSGREQGANRRDADVVDAGGVLGGGFHGLMLAHTKLHHYGQNKH
jgi:hypothetical protein